MNKAVLPQKIQEKPTINNVLVIYEDQIKAALPAHMDVNRLRRIALTETSKNPLLKQCDPVSFLGAVIQCAQLGLEPGNGLGLSYLIPYNNKKKGCQEVNFMIGYRGYLALARRSGEVTKIEARLVHENDHFEYIQGDEEQIIHRPNIKDPGPIVAAYAIAMLKDGTKQREVMSREQIDRIKDRARTQNPVWDSDYDEMARKTVIRRIAKFLPLSPEIGAAMDHEDRESGQSNWDIIDANYEPEPQRVNPDRYRQVVYDTADIDAQPVPPLQEEQDRMIAELYAQQKDYPGAQQ